MNHEDFMQVMQYGWTVPVAHLDKAKKLMAKFKNLRRVLRVWHSKLSNLAATITSNKLVLQFLDILEEFRDFLWRNGTSEPWYMKISGNC
jgi:hypothetical protein